MAPFQFWFDFASTYSHLAALRIESAAAPTTTIEWKPFLLGPIFRLQGWNDSPFNLNPARGRYMWRDVERQAARYGLPFRKPSRFPRDPLLAARVACAAAGAAWLPRFVERTFRANFAHDRDIAQRAVMEEILTDCGANAGATLEAAVAPANKLLLRQQTDRAWELGIFGAPTFIAGGELFWGNDRLEDALAWERRAAGP